MDSANDTGGSSQREGEYTGIYSLDFKIYTCGLESTPMMEAFPKTLHLHKLTSLKKKNLSIHIYIYQRFEVPIQASLVQARN